LPDPADKEHVQQIMREINRAALHTTILLVAFVFCVCGVFGAWR
jgi:hypothetical protein